MTFAGKLQQSSPGSLFEYQDDKLADGVEEHLESDHSAWGYVSSRKIDIWPFILAMRYI